MPYISKWARERALWMTLVEAVTHIQDCDGCTQLEALGQLRQALGEADIPARWAAYPPINRPPSYSRAMPHLLSSEQVPTDAFFWSGALIYLDGNGRVIDEFFLRGPDGEFVAGPTPRGRELFLLRSRVLELWPQLQKLPRRSVNDDEILSAARELYLERKNDPPNKPVAERLIRQKLGGGKRDDIRRILEDEFPNVRRKPGNQPKK